MLFYYVDHFTISRGYKQTNTWIGLGPRFADQGFQDFPRFLNAALLASQHRQIVRDKETAVGVVGGTN